MQYVTWCKTVSSRRVVFVIAVASRMPPCSLDALARETYQRESRAILCDLKSPSIGNSLGVFIETRKTRLARIGKRPPRVFIRYDQSSGVFSLSFSLTRSLGFLSPRLLRDTLTRRAISAAATSRADFRRGFARPPRITRRGERNAGCRSANLLG